MREVIKGTVKFLHGDNMELLRQYKEDMKYKHFHVGIVDPPYGIGVGTMNLGTYNDDRDRRHQFEMGEWDNAVPTQEYWNLLWYCCRNLIIWGGNYFVSALGQVTDPLDPDKVVGIPNGRSFVVWDKGNYKLSFSDGELALTTFDKKAMILKRHKNTTLSMDDEEQIRRHPTQKPVYLYDYLHLNFVERNQRVLDTHGGSFSHAIAAYKNNVDLTIIDRQESYFENGLLAYDKQASKNRLLW